MTSNHSAPTDTVLFIHGLWMTPRSWDRPPMLSIAFEHDHIIPPKVARHNVEKYSKSPATTELKRFDGRPHFPGAPGWEEVADYALSWATEKAGARLAAVRASDPTPP
jgi:hypothetical protein